MNIVDANRASSKRAGYVHYIEQQRYRVPIHGDSDVAMFGAGSFLAWRPGDTLFVYDFLADLQASFQTIEPERYSPTQPNHTHTYACAVRTRMRVVSPLISDNLM